jgi:hypothetical protein
LCEKINKIEWSGVLFYSTEGELGSDDFSMVAEEIYLGDIGSETFTGFEVDSSFIKWRMQNKHTFRMKMGLVHSHHNMRTFFSGTDMDEILENSEYHNYYLSLIVNNAGDMVAKVATRGTIKSSQNTQVTFRGDNGVAIEGSHESTTDKDIVAIFDCDIYTRMPVYKDEAIDGRIAAITEAKEAAKKATAAKWNSSKKYDNDRGYGYGGHGAADYMKKQESYFEQQKGLFDDLNDDFLAGRATDGPHEHVFDDATIRSYVIKWLSLDWNKPVSSSLADIIEKIDDLPKKKYSDFIDKLVDKKDEMYHVLIDDKYEEKKDDFNKQLEVYLLPFADKYVAVYDIIAII